MKNQPTRLTEAERQARRQHQIDLGKATQGYRNLVVLRQNGVIPDGPKTPDPTVKGVSKRQFDKEIREWRRKLHAFDNVDFNGLKAKVHQHQQEKPDAEFLNMLLGNEIREVVQREMMIREQASAAKLNPEYNWRHGSRASSVTPSSVSSEGIRSMARFRSSRSSSMSPASVNKQAIENDFLRLKVQELTYQNNALMERLQQQEQLLRSFMEADVLEAERLGVQYDIRDFAAEDREWYYPPTAQAV